MPEISIIVCTYKRYDLAENCLLHLRRQNLARERFEIVVVDNTPPSLRDVLPWQELGADIVVTEDQAGLSRARNTGIDASSAPLIAFIDDDAEAAPTWAESLVASFTRHADALVVGGRVLAKYVGQTRPAWLAASLEGYLSCIDWGEGTGPLQRGQWIVGANMTFRREVFERFGRFNSSLGRIGHSTLLSNEESLLLDSLPQGSVYYASDAPVNHLIPVERTKQPWFRKRVFWQAISDLLAGMGTSEPAAGYFERFAAGLPKVPAEHRSMRALHRPCSTPEEFHLQLDMLYALTMSQGLGMPELSQHPDLR